MRRRGTNDSVTTKFAAALVLTNAAASVIVHQLGTTCAVAVVHICELITGGN